MNLLHKIQQELSVQKLHENKFADFKYWTLDDIHDAVKPLIKDNGWYTFEDEVMIVGERIYIRSVIKLTDGKQTWSAAGHAREPQSKPKMDDSQCTGSASTYARKYAAAALFLINDNGLDPDSMDNSKKPEPIKNPDPKPTAKPALTHELLGKVIDRIAGGEKGVLTNCQKAFTLTKEQHELILNTELNHTK